ncbi:MAG TPA: DUF4384 domain-containing protein [Steroidobacteraceae bacterium]|nr:DUF4384 domain-containing protein [Steroidobacteraceae bacterium]
MRHRRALTAAALLSSIAFMNAAAARNVALLVAVGQFSDPAMKTHQLLGPPLDLDSMQHALTEHWAFKAADVVTLKDESATHARILSEIAGLEQRSSPGDTLLIYFSGHGTSANDNGNNFALPYDTGAWVPYDLDYSSTEGAQRTLIVGHRDLLPRLQRLDQSGRWVVVISDSCYSGQVVRSFGETHSRSRFLPLNMRDLGVAKVDAPPPPIGVRPPPTPYPYQHVILLSGASDSETGADISTPQALLQAPTLDGQFHGAFTDAFLRLLDGQLLPGTFNYSQGRDALTAFLEHHKFAQHPQLLPAIAEDPQDVGSRPFLGMSAASAAAPAAPPQRDTTLHVHIEGVPPGLRAQVAALKGVTLVEREADLTLKAQGAQVQITGPAGDPIVTAPATDATLIKRVAAQAWLNRALPAASEALGLRAETDPGSRGNTYVQCESFAVEVRLEKPAYVMVLDLDSQGNLSVLYPTSAAERKLVASGVPTAIPGTNPKDRILVVPPFGIDQMAVIAFEREPAFFAGLTGAERFDSDGTRADALARGFAAAAGTVGVQQIPVRTYPGAGKVFCGT